MENEYALYKNDTFITCGTLKEISVETGIAIVTLTSYASPSYKEKNPNGKQLIKIDYERLSERQCERFAFMLKQKRLDNNLSRSQLAKKLGYSQSEIRNWENNIKKPNYYAIEDIATFFNIPINVLIGEK
ncbi:TPA: helix-turn-helix transcriptional regulator [Streptococcus pneumoniae]|uniref:helix-turn-helix domain-containing protein n=1 Tax=Streptococcus pneumoniae TaxID=1313 RepID=UPI0007650D7A|nr:helix-turn-helix transcriptional regulator [Streptococcus pneumoniae]MBW7535607.1 helix-turn-helix transcriptional regulator [Streptococcus pneumoniae]MDG7853725.1 helix-turn-helix domain-containing protein [Streptococcus pneumoniae]MDV8537935.1 helix-turn-helix domain-containing protein [Streptococcus pneumoniae]MDV8538590.1 helix-turn-helix domain-containing protein [Streptococcus pneumoniae]MDV8613644.1 helix-turn-helix domain-containing protein [Streptococcus pneumoniae]